MSRDLRKFAAQTNAQLIFGAFILLFVIGIGLIGWLYGVGSAVMAFLCLIGALVPIGLVVLSLAGLDVLVKRINKD